MAIPTAVITVNYPEIDGSTLLPGWTWVRAYTNIPGQSIIDTSDGAIYSGDEEVRLPYDGVGSITVPRPGGTSNPASWQTSFQVRYRLASNTGAEVVRTFGPYTLTGDTSLGALVAEQDVPPEYATAIVAEMNGIRDEAAASAALARDISNIDTSDAAIDTALQLPGGLAAARLSATYGTYLIAAGTGIDPTGVADSTSALQAKINALSAGGTLFVPKGVYKITGNLTVSSDSVTIRGVGDGTFLDFAGGGLVIDGTTGFTTEVGLYDLSLRRTGTAGPALRLMGGGSGTGVAHFNAANVRVRSSTGEGLLVDGSYIGTFTGCYFMSCATYGIKTAVDSVGGTVFANNLTFVGGETQGCANGMYLDTVVGFTFIGHAIEGNTTAGVELVRATRGVSFLGCYFEANGTAGGGWDIKVGTSATEPRGTVIQGCYFGDGSSAKDRSIILVRSLGTVIQGCDFNAYGLEPVSVQEAATGAVTGLASLNVSDSPGGRVVDYGASTLFGKELAATTVLDYPSIAAGAEADLTATVTGAQVGDKATAHPNGLLEAGCTWYAVVTAANTVTVRVRNNTGAAIDPPARTWRLRVWR